MYNYYNTSLICVSYMRKKSFHIAKNKYYEICEFMFSNSVRKEKTLYINMNRCIYKYIILMAET